MIDPKLIDIELEPAGHLSGGMDDRSFGIPFPDELLIPKSEWKDRITDLKDNDPFHVDGPHPQGCISANYIPKGHTYNQHPESSCVLNATCAAIQTVRNMCLGVEHAIKLSPMWLYCQLARSRHSGSYMWQALELTLKIGALPSDLHADIFAATCHENTPFGWPSKLVEDGDTDTSRHFRPLEYLRIDDATQFCSALLNQYPVVYGRSGHSICARDLVYESRKYMARSLDSYGWDNRDGTGNIYDSERMLSTGGAWALRVVTLPDDPRRPAGDDGL